MSDAITKDNLFRPVLSKAQNKSELTDSTARAIIKMEADDREAKTRRLRQARLEMEARQSQQAPAKGRAGKKSSGSASRRTA